MVKKQTSALVSKILRFDYIVYTCPVMCQSVEFLKLQIKVFMKCFTNSLSDMCHKKKKVFATKIMFPCLSHQDPLHLGNKIILKH